MILDSTGGALFRKPCLLLEGVRDLFIPEACFLCSAPLFRDVPVLARFLCPRCLGTVRLVADPVCPRCSEMIPGSRSDPAGGAASAHCPRCQGRNPGFDRCAAGALYRGAVKDLVLRLKFSRDLKAMLPLGFLALLGAERALRERKSAHHGLSPDAVTAVPLHPLKRFRRGYNQAGLIARVAAREMKVPFVDGLARRIRYTPSQGAGGGQGRRSNMGGAFVPTRRLRRLVAGGRGCVLLVDDVVSTAATLDHCARALRIGGAHTVIGAAAAT